LIGSQCRGHLSSKEKVVDVKQTWVPIPRLRIDYTIPEGRRRILVQHSTNNFYDGLTGTPHADPRPREPFTTIPPDEAYLTPVWSADRIRSEIVETWNHRMELRQTAARERCTVELARLGVPTLATTIDVYAESTLLLPIFVGLLDARVGRRLVAINGFVGQFSPHFTGAMTLQIGSILKDLANPKVRRVA
jgi:hypothetical protein